jgi:hypothetical protein
MTFISKTVQSVLQACKSLQGKKEIERIDSQIDSLREKRERLSGKVSTKKETVSQAKSKHNVSVSESELIINVAANVLVKDICRNLERKLSRNLSKNDETDRQMLYDHLYYFYALKHKNTLPVIHGKNKDYHINDYVAQRTNSVINDVTCHINFGK